MSPADPPDAWAVHSASLEHTASTRSLHWSSGSSPQPTITSPISTAQIEPKIRILTLLVALHNDAPSDRAVAIMIVRVERCPHTELPACAGAMRAVSVPQRRDGD